MMLRRVTPNTMGITWLTATLKDRGDIPVEPLIYVGLDHQPTLAEIVAQFPRHLRLTWPGGRHQILDAHTGEPVFTRDTPTPPEQHEIFRRLVHHWGWWFLRLVWPDRQKKLFYTDFQVMQVGGMVFPLQTSVEAALNDLNQPRDELFRILTDTLQRPPEDQKEAVARDHIEKYEALVGPLPAHLSVLTQPPGTHIVLDRQKFLDGTLTQAEVINAIWATYGKATFEKITVKPKNVKSERDPNFKRPCERCGKVGPRYHYRVRTGTEFHDVCMDCADELGASEMFRRQEPPREKSNHDAVVDGYLRCLQFIQRVAALSDEDHRRLNPLSATSLQDMRYVAVQLAEARLYELQASDLMERLVPAANAYLKSVTGAGPETAECREAAQLLMPQVPMPGPLPFPVVYVGWGAGIPIHGMNWEGGERLLSMMHGWLLCENGYIIALAADTEDSAVAPVFLRRPEGWNYEIILQEAEEWVATAWTATLLIAALNDQQTIIVRQEKTPLRERLAYEKMSKKARQRFLPRPYYTVTISEQVVQDRAKKLPRIVIPREWSHRFDRAAHFRHFVRRGPLPLGDRKRQALQRAGFTVFTDPSQVTGEAMAIIMRRGVGQMRAGEWLATKKTRVAEQEKIPHARLDLPYVPAVRAPEGPLVPDPSKSK